MKGRQVGRVNQHSLGETPLMSGILQRAAVRAVAGKEWEAAEEMEPGRLRESRFRHDFSQMPIHRGGLPPIQAKLTIGAPNDKYEQEADRVASQVVQQINAPASVQSSQGQSEQRTEAQEEEELQAKPENTSIQRRVAIASGEVSSDLTSAINSARGGGQALDAGLQQSMGQAMGADFSGVKVHTDAQSNQLNQSIQAKAFTTGQDVFFRQGGYDPGSRGGQELIAHELTHVVQQNGGAVRRSPAPQNILQRALNNKTLAGYSRSKGLTAIIAKKVNDYNHEIRSKTNKKKINELNELQNLLLNWFDENKKGDLNENPVAESMKTMLNEVQEEHQKVVKLSVKKQDVDPPVANFDVLSEPIKAKVRKVWNDLVNATGNVVITEEQEYTSTENGKDYTIDHKGFQDEALATFARLLESEFGRELLIRANQDTGAKKKITIRPGNSLGHEYIPSEEFIANAKEDGKGELKEVDAAKLFGNKKKRSRAWRKVNKYLQSFPVLNIPKEATVEDRIQLIHDAPKKFAAQVGYRIKDGDRWRYYEFNEGTGSEIVFTRDIKDASDHMTSRFIDKDGNEIIVPVFITLAHELGHALHFLEGNTVGKVAITNSLGGIVAPPEENFADWSNLEEYHTIKGVENRVRKDVGATERFSHHNFLSYTAQVIRSGPLEAAYDAAAKLAPPARTTIEDLLGEVNTALGQRDLKKAKQLLRKAQAMLKKAEAALVKAELEEDRDDEAETGRSQGLFKFWPFAS